MLPPKRDRARVAAGQLASKAYFTGEASGFHLARVLGQLDILAKVVSLTLKSGPPRDDAEASPKELEMLKERLANAIKDIAAKKPGWSAHDLKRLLFRCASVIVSLDWVGQSERQFPLLVLIAHNSVIANCFIISLRCLLRPSILPLFQLESKRGRG